MRHAIDHRKLRRDPAHRKALLRNLMNALVRSERIQTTIARAKELRRLADRLITLGKRDTIHARRRVFSLLSDKKNTAKIFEGLAGRFTGREGGYTRIVRTGYRAGDGAEMAILEYLPVEEKKAAARKGRKKKGAGAREKASRTAAASAKTKGKEKKGPETASRAGTEGRKPARRKPKAPKEGEKAE